MILQSAADNCSGASSLKLASVYPLKEELNPFADISATHTLIDVHCLYSWNTGPEYTDEISGRPGRDSHGPKIYRLKQQERHGNLVKDTQTVAIHCASQQTSSLSGINRFDYHRKHDTGVWGS